MSQVKVSGNASGSGTLTIAAPNTNTDYTLTLPTNTGTLISTASTFAGTGPAFSATPSVAQTLTISTATKISLNVENFDTASCYNNTGSTVGGIPAYSFLPNVAGYYQVNLSAAIDATTSLNYAAAIIYKNATQVARNFAAPYASSNGESAVSVVVYMNGSTDYLSFYVQTNGTGTITTIVTGNRIVASAALIRSA